MSLTRIDKKLILICLPIIIAAILVSNLWRFKAPSSEAALAVSLYTEILKEVNIVGVDFSSLTTTVGYYPAKRVSEDPITAALMVRILQDAGAAKGSVIAINASGSFPGFTLAALAACAALELEAHVIASIGSSTFGANVPGATIADMLMKDSVQSLGHSILGFTPGGSRDRGLSMDQNEINRVSRMAQNAGIPFYRPQGLVEAIELRETLFREVGSTILVNVGGNHAASGESLEFYLLAGVLDPNEIENYDDPGLMQSFLRAGRPVIQILNVRRLYADYGLEFNERGQLLGNTEFLLR
ncbi:MAG: poly-gamma-glutamate system protein [Treponema sp.]|nr:poly-gamma-glutamate system protein [Treponema sp.]